MDCTGLKKMSGVTAGFFFVYVVSLRYGPTPDTRFSMRSVLVGGDIQDDVEEVIVGRSGR
jgi:hypothetical protein